MVDGLTPPSTSISRSVYLSLKNDICSNQIKNEICKKKIVLIENLVQ